MAGSDGGSRRAILALGGICGFCCVTLAALTGGAAVTGGAAGGTAASGGIASIGGLLVTALATALPLRVVGLLLRYRARRS